MNFFRKETKMVNHHKSEDLIKDLVIMLSEYGDKILSEEIIFSLNSSSLTCLNKALTQISTEERNVTFDVVQTNNSKLAFFHDLQFLYDFIQKITALKLNHGNSTLQGRFNICRFRSLKSLEIKKIPIHLIMGLQYLRPKLESIICSRSLQNLEGLFGKCGGDMSQPFTWCELKNVNLGYNGIETLDDSLRLLPYLEVLNLSHNNIKYADNLEHLTVLKHISLSYNCLQECPIFSNSSRGTLVSLNLCNNYIESLDGIDELCALEDLDVSGNCLMSHSVLKKVMLLKHLKSLNMIENPMSYHKSHRKYSIKYLHPNTAKSKFVQEAQIFSISKRLSNGKICVEIEDDDSRPTSSHASLNTSAHSVHRPHAELESSLEYSHSPMQRRRKKASKITDAIILDPSELDVSKSTPPEKTQLTEEHLEIKTKVENAREKFGQEWLIVGKQNIGLPVTNNSFDSASALSFKTEENDTRAEMENPNTSAEITVEDLDSCTKKTTEQPSNMYDENNIDSNSPPEDSLVIENGAFYVVHTENKDFSPCIISVGSRYIVEKDSMTGKVFDELDLSSLVRYEQINQGEDSISLLLIFDYVKKSRRERIYHFENEDQFNSFIKHLEPFIMKRNLEAISKGALQCLKCCAQFYKDSAVLKIKTVEKIISGEQSSYPSSYNGNEGYLVEVPACPNCESDMVVEIDLSSDSTIPKRKASTPLSSSTSNVMFEASFEADQYLNKDDSELLIRSLDQKLSNERVPKMVNNDAVIYSSQNSQKNEIKVEAEVYSLQSGIEHIDLNTDTTNETHDLVIHKEIARTDSDLSILSNPSQSSIAVISSQTPPEYSDNAISRTSSEVMENWSKNNLGLEMPRVQMATKDTLQKINEDIFGLEEGEIVDDQYNVSLYVMGWWKQNNASMIPVSFIFTSSDIYIIEDNHEWPIPLSVGNSENSKTAQFKLLGQQQIMNLNEIKCDTEMNDPEAHLLFSDDSAKEAIWHICMDTVFTLHAVIKAIKTPWEELYKVDLNTSSRIEST
ncbi:Serine/threonine-protein kinase 11-interacting protein [Nymphon striatum]|nr:Serine/threonine-protein kinase 11-interacting protein [Nymphon striatum]